MRVRSSYPTPIDGVSTVTPINRGRSAAEEQINMRSNPVSKLTRRPSLERKAEQLLFTDEKFIVHTYRRRNNYFEIIKVNSGSSIANQLIVFKNGERVTDIEFDFGVEDYLYTEGGNVTFTTINDTTFIANTGVEVKKELIDYGPDFIGWPQACHINILDALNYGETLEVTIDELSTQQSNILQPLTVSVEIDSNPDNYEDADKVRGTSAVAEALAAAINEARTTEGSLYFAVSKGSCISICAQAFTLPDLTNITNRPIEAEVKTGQGDSSVKVFNNVVSSPEGLPLYARPGTVVKIKSNILSDDGVYYLEAVPLTGETDLDFWYSEVGTIEEVTWVETTVRPSGVSVERFRFDPASMPVVLMYDNETDSIKVSLGQWSPRGAGDDKTVPFPSLVGNTIVSMTYFQKRLVLLSENEVYMSETDNLYNFFKESATELLVTDTISIASSASGADFLAHVIPHNRDLLIISSNSQYKIDGSTAITPRNVSMPLSTTFNCQVDVAPATIGSTVYIPSLYGDSAGLLTYEGVSGTDNRDVGTSITHHVIGYMQGRVKQIKASPNLDMLVVTVTGEPENILYIYEREVVDGKLAQSAWSKWELPMETRVKDFEFNEEVLNLYCASETTAPSLVMKYIDLYSEKETATYFLDDLARVISEDESSETLNAEGNTVFSSFTLPTNYPSTDIVIVQDNEQGNYIFNELMEVEYSVDGNTIEILENLGVPNPPLIIGRRFRSSYTPTRPYIRNNEGMAEDDFRLRVNRFIATVRDSGPVRFSIKSKIANYPDQENSGRKMGSDLNRVSIEDLYSGELVYSYKQNADTALAEFYTEGHLGMTISALRWEGQYNERGKKI